MLTSPNVTKSVTAIHNAFDNSIPPVLTIESGDTVHFDCPSSFDWGKDATIADMAKLRALKNPHLLIGPIEIRGAEPGDALVVEVLDVKLTGQQGITAFGTTFGLLSDDVKEPCLKVIPFVEGYGIINENCRVRLRPFLGVMGLAPAEPGEHRTTPPRRVGGNIDNRHLQPGSRLVLPVEVPGAMFSCGDGHGTQGDGEVCGTGIEANVAATLRFSLEKGAAPPTPQAFIGPRLQEEPPAEHFMTSGLGEDLFACSQDAVRNMIVWLVSERQMTWDDAYILCSLAVDLKITEIVNRPTWMVGASLPLSVFA